MTLPSIAVQQKARNYMGGTARAMQVRGRGREALNESMMRAGEPQIASRQRMVREYRAKVEPRFRIGDGKGLFLGRDGLCVTDVRREAWFGTADQAGVALARFDAAQGMRALPVLRLPDALPRSI